MISILDSIYTSPKKAVSPGVHRENFFKEFEKEGQIIQITPTRYENILIAISIKRRFDILEDLTFHYWCGDIGYYSNRRLLPWDFEYDDDNGHMLFINYASNNTPKAPSRIIKYLGVSTNVENDFSITIEAYKVYTFQLLAGSTQSEFVTPHGICEVEPGDIVYLKNEPNRILDVMHINHEDCIIYCGETRMY